MPCQQRNGFLLPGRYQPLTCALPYADPKLTRPPSHPSQSTTLATNADPKSTLTWFNDIYTNVGFAFIFEQQNGRTLAQLVTTVPPRVNPGQCDQSRLGRPLRAESLTGTIQGKLEPAAGSAGYASYRVPKALVVLTVGITAVLWS